MQELIGQAFDYIVNVISSIETLIPEISLIILFNVNSLSAFLTSLLASLAKINPTNRIIKDMINLLIIDEKTSHFVLYFVYFISIIMALHYLGIATDILNIISGVVMLMIAIFVILSVKDFIPNVISGIVIHQKSLIKIGDKITTNNISGKVVEITLLDTKLKTKSGDIIIIPNSNLTKNEIIKKSK
jgi:small-conductance mechanosensitive channel